MLEVAKLEDGMFASGWGFGPAPMNKNTCLISAPFFGCTLISSL